MDKCCENCVYYDTDRTDQPCCSCVCGCNFESEVDTECPTKKLTDSEIKKGLECCKSDTALCSECPYYKIGECIEKMCADSIDLINRQKAENKSQSIMIKMLKGSIEDYKNSYINQKAEIEKLKESLNIELENFATEYDNKIKAEAYKEFAERLKEWFRKESEVYKLIDNLLKEMVGENNEI